METLEEVLAEFKCLYKELGVFDRQTILDSLCNLRDNIIKTYNVLDIKAAYAKENLKKYICIYVQDSDANSFIIIDKYYVCDTSTFKLRNGELKINNTFSNRFNYYLLPSGPSENLAWADAYNKLLAINKE